MTDEALKRLARQTGMPIKRIAEWHFVHAPRFVSAVQRAHKRPDGMLSVTDIVVKYQVDPPTLMKWRRAGLKTLRKGKMVLIKESDLADWMKEHRFVRRPLGRPKGS